MSTWPVISLGEVLTRHDDWVSLDPDTDYRQITVRLWGKGLTQRAIVKGSTIAAAHQNRVKTGQFLISKIDARHGAFGLVPAELDGAVVSGDFPTFDVNADRVLPGLINWVSKTDWFIALCKRASEGSTNRVRLKEDRFLNQEIPLPPINIQRRIVAQLDRVADQLLARQSATAALEAELDAMLYAAFARIIANVPRASPHCSVRREKPRVSSGRDKANPPGNYSLRPEPPGGVMEVTKSLKHFRKRPLRGSGST